MSAEVALDTTGIRIELSPLFKLVRRTHVTVENETEVFEPNTNLTEERQNGYFDTVSIQMGAYRELNPNREFHKLQC